MRYLQHRKIGGMRWLFIGRLRVAFCVKRKPVPKTYRAPRNWREASADFERREALRGHLCQTDINAYVDQAIDELRKSL